MNGKNRGLRADAAAKRFLHRRSIVATIIGGLVDECRGMPRAEIESYLGEGEYLEGAENDSFLIPRREDITFEKMLPLPNGDGIHLIINLEPQDDGSGLERLWERGRDHSADLTMRQGSGRRRIMKNLEGRFPGKHKVHMKTMSVWILMSPRADLRNSIHVFAREDHVAYGPRTPKLEMTDDDAIAFICLGNPEEDGGIMPELLRALDWSMARGIDDRKRAEKLSELGYEVDREMESELIGMNSIEADRERRARREGVAEGRIEGKIEDASRMLADGISEDKVRQYTGLTEEQMEEARNLRRAPQRGTKPSKPQSQHHFILSFDGIPDTMAMLGFGLMRLPLKDPADQSSVDVEQTKRMVDMYMDSGLDYFDTAYMYHSNQSEKAIKEALVDRYPRDSYRIATKLPIMMVSDPNKAEEIFDEQLEKIGIDYFDCYLIHNICSEFLPNAESCKAFDLVKRKKAEGRIRRIGFSFHDGPELLNKVLTEHPEMEFVQLQVNYLDMDDSSIASRANLEVARRHGIPVIVMEPVKGGILADVPEEAERILRDMDPDLSPAAWALRFAMSQEGVEIVLSGMSSVEQMEDNLRACKGYGSMSQEEIAAVEKAAKIISSNIAIPCTRCRYCMKTCPKDVLIADYFELYNAERANPSKGWSVPEMYYKNRSKGHGRASDCIGCGKCEEQCPQHLKIIDLLKDVAGLFEKSRSDLPNQSNDAAYGL